jgi:hypothetical protein
MDTQDQGFYALDRSFDGSASLGLRAPRKSQGGTQEEEVVVRCSGGGGRDSQNLIRLYCILGVLKQRERVNKARCMSRVNRFLLVEGSFRASTRAGMAHAHILST